MHLVEITAYSDEDAYTIFETMNDRGLSLTPTDMLKGYLLANITDSIQRTAASQVWKSQIGKLLDLGKDEDADGIKSWLRSQYAQSIRERKQGAAPQDFDLIGTEFHRWVRDHEEASDCERVVILLTLLRKTSPSMLGSISVCGRRQRRLRQGLSAFTTMPRTTSPYSTRYYLLHYV